MYIIMLCLPGAFQRGRSSVARVFASTFSSYKAAIILATSLHELIILLGRDALRATLHLCSDSLLPTLLVCSKSLELKYIVKRDCWLLDLKPSQVGLSYIWAILS
jgi:hypothetical protein